MALHTPSYPNALRVLIENAGYTFKEIAERIHISERTLYDWAAGNRAIPHQHRKTIARVLGCSMKDLAPTSITTTIDLQLTYGQTQYESIEDMDKKRRLILQALGITGSSLILPTEALERLSSAVAKPTNMDSSTLLHFQKVVEHCWHLSNGSDLDTAQQLLSTCLPQIAIFAQQPSDHQIDAARLASLGFQLSYVLASQNEDFSTALAACSQARYYGCIAQDCNLQAAALIRQGVTYLNKKRPYQTLEALQEARQLEKHISPLVRTRLYAGLAEVQGKLQMAQEASRSIGLAHESFPDDPASDPSSQYIHFNYSSVWLHEGLALLDLHQPAQAAKALEQIDGLQPKLVISERSRIDVLNQQALAAGQQSDLDGFKRYMEAAVTSAIRLGSDLRISEAWEIFTRMRNQWKHEPTMKALSTVFIK